MFSLITFGYSQYNSGVFVDEIPVNFPKENSESTFTEMYSDTFRLSPDMNPIKIRLRIQSGEKFAKNYKAEKRKWRIRNSSRSNIQISPSIFELLEGNNAVWKVSAIKEIRRGGGGLAHNHAKYKTINVFEIDNKQDYKIEMSLNNALLQKQVENIFIEIRKNAIEPPEFWGLLSFLGILMGIVMIVISKKRT